MSPVSTPLVVLALVASVPGLAGRPAGLTPSQDGSLRGTWRAVLDLEGGQLPFRLEIGSPKAGAAMTGCWEGARAHSEDGNEALMVAGILSQVR